METHVRPTRRHAVAVEDTTVGTTLSTLLKERRKKNSVPRGTTARFHELQACPYVVLGSGRGDGSYLLLNAAGPSESICRTPEKCCVRFGTRFSSLFSKAMTAINDTVVRAIVTWSAGGDARLRGAPFDRSVGLRSAGDVNDGVSRV